MANLEKNTYLNHYEQKLLENISSIAIDDLYGDTRLYLQYTSLEKTFAFSGIRNNSFFINREFYEINSFKTNKLILDIISNTKEDSFILSDEMLINDEVIKALVSNTNIKNINLQGNIYLDKKTIKYILSSHICHLCCNVNFDNEPELFYQYIPGLDIINYPEIAGVSVMNFGKENVQLYIIKTLTKKELSHLKMLFTIYPQEKTYINLKDKSQVDKIIDVINSNKIIIRRFVPFTKEEYMHLNEKYNNVFFSVASSYEVSIKSLISREEIMESIITEVNELNLSPLEKYMYLYNVVKMYKEYKEVGDVTKLELSRYSEYTLFNDYMVCVGYATLLEELVDRLNDKNVICTTYSCSVLDNGIEYGHCRCLTKIKDEKYGIDGIYISDPTWDAIKYFKKEKKRKHKAGVSHNIPVADIDLYNHFLLTKNEVMDEQISYSTIDASDFLFNNTNEDDMSRYENISWELERINQKFNDYTKNVVKSNPISGEILIKAITNLYTIVYSDEHNDIDKFLQHTIKENISSQYKNFDTTKEKFGIKMKIKK